ncbi:MAG: sodium-translocating pyrophosphatase [Planctomycetes bacterium]|nr:sodium-translocating pyrophosphatase [Planctomycetota bacterium]
MQEIPLFFVIGISIAGLVFAGLLAKWVLAQDRGTPAMQAISDAIQSGAEAFLRRQNRAIISIAVPVALAIYILYAFIRAHNAADPVEAPTTLAMWTTISFAFGATCSVIAGYVGMWISIRSNIRTASAARSSINKALQIAMRGGAVSGFLVVTMSLLGVGGLFWIVKLTVKVEETKIPLLIAGYGFGASLVALFAQLGGGIYTKAADVGADLVGKVEAGIPEDDPRNPAVIADLVGDNVGDCAGRGADLFESTAAENIGAMILGATLAGEIAGRSGITFEHGAFGVMLFPLVARACGIIASAIGLAFTKIREDEDPMNGLNRGYWVSSGLAAVGFFISTKWLLATVPDKTGKNPAPDAWMWFFACGLIGIAVAQAFVYITQYYTEYKYRPVKSIAQASVTGPATNVIAGIAVGLECTAMPVFVIVAAILGSYTIGEHAIPGAGLFGTAVATMGMLGTAAYILAMDTFGPITDNAGGIVEMSQQPEEIRKKTDRLDAVGNTTKALTKGYAIGSAALAAFLLFSAYLDEVRNYCSPAAKSAMFRDGGTGAAIIDLSKPAVFSAGLIGAMLVFVFAALAIKAVGSAAMDVIKAVREEFKNKPGILKGTEKPDYGRCVDIVTRGALRQMILPGLIAVSAPAFVGLLFKLMRTEKDTTIGAEAVAGFLMVATIAGVLLAMFLNNAGGAWDNAKKYIETGEFKVDGKSVGKRSDPHKAAVVGDTVGDPFKDTAGPALHVLIKLIATVTLVLAPFFL